MDMFLGGFTTARIALQFSRESLRFEVMKKYYIPFDVHFNKQGNKLVAKKFLGKYFPDRNF
tara:strand:- start:2153 stop:2335 length:183 start_codon:yes stop_codon:yes gene_type:complete